jgi:hypothetical protein
MRDVFALEPTTPIPADNSYITSYPYLLEYFASRSSFDAGDVVRGAHMAYGWMPTIVHLYPENGKDDLTSAAIILTKAKKGGDLSKKEIGLLATLVNHSLVGASKLLHFVAPEHFPIWDSKVYTFIHEKEANHNRVNSIDAYAQYKALLQDLARNDAFPTFHASVNRKLGYSVSPLRALEIIMFQIVLQDKKNADPHGEREDTKANPHL